MSADGHRPLPPRALPPLIPESGAGGQPVRTPRKKTNVRQTTGTAGPSSARTRRPRPDSKNSTSPRSQDKPSDVSSLQPSAGASKQDDPQVSENSATASQKRTRKTRRRKLPSTNGGTPGTELTPENNINTFINEEDVVNVDKIDDAVVMTNLPWVPAGSGGSAVHDKVYVQTTNGFAAHSQDWVDQRNKAAASEARLTYGEESVQPFNIAKQNERGFMFLTLVLHGALAGLAIWQVVASYSLFQLGLGNFLTQYQSLAMPTQTVYYIILILCTVSAMDRYDFAGKDKHIFESLAKFDLAAVAVVVYYIALLFSIGIAGLDAWISSGAGLSSEDATDTATSTTLPPLSPELTGENLDPATTVNTWLILIIFRAVFASLGWLIVAFDPMRNDMTWEK